METDDLVAIQDAHDALSEAAQKLGEAIYKQGQGGSQSAPAPTTGAAAMLNADEEPDFLDENTFDD